MNRNRWVVAGVGVAAVAAIAVWLGAGAETTKGLEGKPPEVAADDSPLVMDPLPKSDAGEHEIDSTKLTADTRITGVVLGDDGKPLAGARVSTPAEGHDVAVMTADDGSFELAPLSEGVHVVEVQHDNHAPFKKEFHATSLDVTLRLEAGLSISGVVVDAAGKPLVAEVKVVEPEDPDAERDFFAFEEPNRLHATSDAQGRFRIRGLVAGPQTVEATTDEGEAAPQPVTLSAGRETTVRLVVTPASTISGVAVDSKGAILPGAKVMAFPRDGLSIANATTDARGAFVLRKLESDSKYLLILMGDMDHDSAEVHARVGQHDVKLVRLDVAKVRGRIVDEAGPLSRCSVNHREMRSERFELNLPDRETMTLQITCGGYATVTKSVAGEGKDVDLGDINVSGRRLRFRVVDADTGKALNRASIRTVGEAPLSPGEPGTTSSNGGVADMSGFPETKAVAIVSHPSYLERTVEIEDAANEVLVKLDLAPALDVKVTVTRGKPSPIQVEAYEDTTGRAVYAHTDKSGRAKLEGLAQGTWTLSADTELLRGRMSVQVPPRGVSPVTLPLKAGTADVTLVVPSGLDAEELRVFVFPPGIRTPATVGELFKLRLTGIDAELKGAKDFVVDGLEPGPHRAAVLRERDGREEMFVAPFEVTAEKTQTVTLAQRAWVSAAKP